MIDPTQVAVYRGDGAYPAEPPYSPGEAYPEYAANGADLGPSNAAYRAVREALRLLGLDAGRFGTAAWNPLGELVRPGETVVLKPNFIRDFHDTDPAAMPSVVTHGSVIRAVLDYVVIALTGRGRIVIADAPQCEASFERIAAMTGLAEIAAFHRRRSDIPLDVIDLRPECAEKVDGVIVGHRRLPGDPAGYVKVNLGRDSEFMPVNHLNHLLYGSEYDRSEVAAHHHDDVHEYLISRTVMDADVFINLPKMKTHKKVGVTLNLKNLVGINGNKNWLPHHREGVPARGGDQFASSGMSERVEQVVGAAFKRHFPKLGRLRRALGGPAKRMGTRVFGDTNTNRIRSGNWHGNDTTWRMVLDLNRALMYGDGEGALHTSRRRRYFSFVDGVIAGEGNGPMGTTSRPAGLLVAGADPVAVDLTCARLMGFDWRRIPQLVHAVADHRYPIAQTSYGGVKVRSNAPGYDRALEAIDGACLAFEAHFGWKGEIEIGSRPERIASGK